jgi:transposase InsO family protein
MLLKNKTAIVVFTALKSLFRSLKNRYGRYPARFQFDAGLEIANQLISNWLKRKGIAFTTSSPYTHEQNGLAERSIKVILDRLRTTIQASGLPLYLWCFILPAIVDLINRTAITNKDLTLY